MKNKFHTTKKISDSETTYCVFMLAYCSIAGVLILALNLVRQFV